MITTSHKKIIFTISLILYALYNIFLYDTFDGFLEIFLFSLAIISGAWLSEDFGKYKSEKIQKNFSIGMILIILAIAVYGMLSHNPREIWANLLLGSFARGLVLALVLALIDRKDG